MAHLHTAEIQFCFPSMADQSVTKPSNEETCGEDSNKSSADTALDDAGKVAQDDSELNELLNSALQDFSKMKISPAAEKPASTTTADETAELGAFGGKPEGAEAEPTSTEFTEMFSDRFAIHFEETLTKLVSRNSDYLKEFEKLVSADTDGDSQDDQQNFMATTLTRTLSDMSTNAEGIQSDNLDGDVEGQGEDIMPIMQEMMQTLLSKSVLYPSLKEIADKYPAYLSKNEGKLEASVFDRYRRQYELMSSICGVYEEENTGDTEEIKSQRFEKLLDLMQQVQDQGQPPKDIVGEIAPGLEFGDNGLPKLQGMDSNSQCSLM